MVHAVNEGKRPGVDIDGDSMRRNKKLRNLL
jgi:hypothetical protein